MKRYIITALFSITALLFSCTPENNGISGFVFQEKELVSIRFESQFGDAIITAFDDTTGLVEIKLAVDSIPDLSKVHVTSIVPSYGSNSSLKSGDEVDFTGSTPRISVTSQAGKTRVYDIEMTPFVEDFPGNYAVNGNALVGGIGEWAWNTMGLTSRPDTLTVWDTNGYGPSANYDNYLEVVLTNMNNDNTTEGYCINYGGADGKHWNCIYHKKDDNTLVDVHKFYRKIPIGLSKWKRDYNNGTITFRDSLDKETVCAIYDSDIEVNAQAQKSIKVTGRAFAFACDGDYTWDNNYLYTAYQKYAVAARYYFYLVSKVDEIPAASKIIGDEGVIDLNPGGEEPGDNPGTDPGPSVDFSDFAGNYKVNGLFVYGGVYCTGFVSVTEKAWNWTSYYRDANYKDYSNADREMDNTLTITISGSTGTLNYGPGADGEYWDYHYLDNNNNYGGITRDVSYNYGQLPHGESTFSINPSTMVITITANNKTVYGMVLGPGVQSVDSHDNAGKKESITVPEGCIAIGFQLTAYQGTDIEFVQYTDLDRFLLHPYYYVMIFKKQ